MTAEVPEPTLVLPVALVLGVLVVTKRLRPGGSNPARDCGERV
ncbi:MAG: PEP-CTERM sorting domain-containing protein [Bryobacterales bacterium]|nr:PEP-CTERM sorting domain-containing protein [Bryobacterales bacterium]